MMHYVIDGYNLLHVMGLIRDPLGPMGLEKARLRLLGLLHGAYTSEEAARVTVVFDAAGAVRGASGTRDYKGIHVRFAVGHAEADDLIEQLIHDDSAPKQLRVVSDDNRIKTAARHRHCVVVPCSDYLEWLARHRAERLRPPSAPAGKPQSVSEAETRHWLDEFADLEDDPAWKEFIAMYEFGDGSSEPPGE